MRAGQGRLAAMEIARALTLVDGLTVYWYPKAFADTRGFTGSLAVISADMQPPMSKTGIPPQIVTWSLLISGPSDAASSGSATEEKYLDLVSSQVSDVKPVSIYDAIRNYALPTPFGWPAGARPMSPQLALVTVGRRDDVETDAVIRAEIEVVL